MGEVALLTCDEVAPTVDLGHDGFVGSDVREDMMGR